MPTQADLDLALGVALLARGREPLLGAVQATPQIGPVGQHVLQLFLEPGERLMKLADPAAGAIPLLGERDQLTLARVELALDGVADLGQLANRVLLMMPDHLELIDLLDEALGRQLGLGFEIGVGLLEILDVLSGIGEQMPAADVADRGYGHPGRQAENDGAGRELRLDRDRRAAGAAADGDPACDGPGAP